MKTDEIIIDVANGAETNDTAALYARKIVTPAASASDAELTACKMIKAMMICTDRVADDVEAMIICRSRTHDGPRK